MGSPKAEQKRSEQRPYFLRISSCFLSISSRRSSWTCSRARSSASACERSVPVSRQRFHGHQWLHTSQTQTHSNQTATCVQRRRGFDRWQWKGDFITLISFEHFRYCLLICVLVYLVSLYNWFHYFPSFIQTYLRICFNFAKHFMKLLAKTNTIPPLYKKI